MKLSRDTKYFDGKIYSFVNKDLHRDLKIVSDLKKKPIFYQIDEAFRLYLAKELAKEYPKPKTPQLV